MIFKPADVLIPKNIDLTKWSVIACDQYSSEPQYWQRVGELAGDAPSALRMIVPEAFLGHPDIESYTLSVGKTAEEYINLGIFAEYSDCLIYTQRTLRDGRVRRGLIGALDLDSYDFTGLPTKIRATEQTVPARLPPRSKARLGSPLEMPHVMALIDDETDAVFSRLDGRELPLLYDFELMENGGRLTGYFVEGGLAHELASAIDSLPRGIMIGDGNHSLAAAKTAWEATKRTLPKNAQAAHPSRCALAELNNVYDSAIDFHAIHRVVLASDTEGFVRGLHDAAGGNGDYTITLICGGEERTLRAKDAPIGDIIAAVQDYIDDECEKNGYAVDYIHGEESLRELLAAPGSVGILLPTMDKKDLFRTVEARGVFPRKSFSIGEAWDKRYYLECRKIK